MWKFGWCLATKELRRRRRQFTNAIWIPFSMPVLNLMCPGSKSEIALLMFKWWILTLLVGMNLLGKFFWHVSIINSTPKLRYNEQSCQAPFVHYIAKFTISNFQIIIKHSTNLLIFHLSSQFLIIWKYQQVFSIPIIMKFN